MCFPIPSDDIRIRGTTPPAGPRTGPASDGSGLNDSTGAGRLGDDPLEDPELERRKRQLADMGSIFDAFDKGATSAFAVFGPRLGVQSISDVRPGEQGRQTSITDLKAAV